MVFYEIIFPCKSSNTPDNNEIKLLQHIPTSNISELRAPPTTTFFEMEVGNQLEIETYHTDFSPLHESENCPKESNSQVQ